MSARNEFYTSQPVHASIIVDYMKNNAGLVAMCNQALMQLYVHTILNEQLISFYTK